MTLFEHFDTSGAEATKLDLADAGQICGWLSSQ
jgi:hypothetical protein